MKCLQNEKQKQYLLSSNPWNIGGHGMSNLLPNDYFCWHTHDNIKPLETLISFLNETKKGCSLLADVFSTYLCMTENIQMHLC